MKVTKGTVEVAVKRRVAKKREHPAEQQILLATLVLLRAKLIDANPIALRVSRIDEEPTVRLGCLWHHSPTSQLMNALLSLGRDL